MNALVRHINFRPQSRRAPALLLAALTLTVPGCGSPPDTEVVDHTGESANIVTLTPTQIESGGIELAPVRHGPVEETLHASAVIEPSADGVARVSSRVPGRVVEVMANVGDSVAAGQPLVTVDSPELGRAKADYLAALANDELLAQIAEQERALFLDRITSEQDLRRAEAAALSARTETEASENRLHALGIDEEGIRNTRDERHYTSTLHLSSPISGIVVEREVVMGEMIDPTHVPMLVMDLTEVWVIVDVYDTEIARIALGQEVVATTRAFPDRMFTGVVGNIGAIVDPNSRSVQIRVVLPNPDRILRPGMFADVEIAAVSNDAGPGLRVPAEAVQRVDGVRFVFLRTGEGLFERRDVTLGRESRLWTEVLSGLQDGDTVVAKGAFVLRSELGKGDLGEHGH